MVVSRVPASGRCGRDGDVSAEWSRRGLIESYAERACSAERAAAAAAGRRRRPRLTKPTGAQRHPRSLLMKPTRLVVGERGQLRRALGGGEGGVAGHFASKLVGAGEDGRCGSGRAQEHSLARAAAVRKDRERCVHSGLGLVGLERQRRCQNEEWEGRSALKKAARCINEFSNSAARAC